MVEEFVVDATETKPATPITTPDTPTRPRPTRPGIVPTEVPSEEDAPLAAAEKVMDRLKRIYSESSKEEKDMHDFQDKTVLIVNTASESEFTNQYKDLELFYRKYKDKGFEIVAFPCGQFKQGEPNGTEYHLNFCKENFISFTICDRLL